TLRGRGNQFSARRKACSSCNCRSVAMAQSFQKITSQGPLAKNREIGRKLPGLQTANLGSGVSSGAPVKTITWLCPLPALPRRRIHSGSGADHGQILALPTRGHVQLAERVFWARKRIDSRSEVEVVVLKLLGHGHERDAMGVE